jgi:hypothetical protein
MYFFFRFQKIDMFLPESRKYFLAFSEAIQYFESRNPNLAKHEEIVELCDVADAC